jgi:hypothetical protein
MVKAIRDFEIEIDKDGVCRSLGYGNGRGSSSSISSLIDEEIEEAYDFIQPSCSYRTMDIRRVRRPRVTLEDGLVITSEVLSWVLLPCQMAVIFVASIGRGLEDRVSQLMEQGHMVKAALLDTIGSEAAEKTICYLQDEVRGLAELYDADVTLRYSPGFCDWDITQQRVLFDAMDSAPIGVSLSEECLMMPRKSVSGIIGLGWGEKRRLRLSPCRFCTKVDCLSRR